MKKTITFLSKRAAMMLLTTLLLTLTAQTAWAEDVVHYYYSINLAFSGGSGTVTMDGRENPLEESNSNVGEFVGGVIDCHLHIVPDAGYKVSSVSYSYNKEGGGIFGPDGCFIDGTSIDCNAHILRDVWNDIDHDNLTFTVNVVFEAINYSIHVNVNGRGTVMINSNDVTGGGDIGDVTLGTIIPMTITPHEGYSISSVTGSYHNQGDYVWDLIIYVGETYEFTYPDAQEIKWDNPVVTVNVVFSPIDYNITYNLNGGTNNNLNPSTYNFESGIVELKNPSKTGYTFDGWYDNENFGGEPIDHFVADESNDLHYLQNREFWAKWTANTYTVVFDANGGSGEMGDMNLTYDGDWINLIAFGFTAPAGKAFKNWNTAQDGSGVSYNDEAPVRNLTDAHNGTVTLYAQWANDIASCNITVPDQTLEGPNDLFKNISYKFEYANNNSGESYAQEFIRGMGVEVKDGQTTLSLGTDYTFGSVTLANNNPIGEYSQIGDECKVEIVGQGNYAGNTWAEFKIKNPDGEWGGLTWSLASDGTLTITGTGTMNNTENYNGYDFPWLNYRSSITAIVIGEGITNVANKAFGAHTGEELYSKVASVSLPSSLTTIGSNAFDGCKKTGLTINIPPSVTSVGEGAFTGVACVTAELSDAVEDNTTYLSALAGASTADVSFSRTFNAGKASTVCLPFEVSPAAAKGKFYTFVGVGYTEQTGWVATMQEPNATTLTANTPYLFKPSGESGTIDVDFSGSLTNLASVLPGETVANTAEGTWTFKGTYKKLTYAAVESNENPFSGKVFGFAANSMGEGEDDVKAGEFVRADDGASIRAFRAFLKYAGDETSLQARGTRRGETVVPEYITVRLIGKNGDVDAIGEISLSTGEVTFDSNAWYDLSGRRHAEKPTQRGIYIHKGKKVVLH